MGGTEIVELWKIWGSNQEEMKLRLNQEQMVDSAIKHGDLTPFVVVLNSHFSKFRKRVFTPVVHGRKPVVPLPVK